MKRVITSETHYTHLFHDIIQKKELLILLTKREILLRYKQAPVAILWGILKPLLLSYVIAHSLGALMDNEQIPYYFLSLFIGFSFWNYFTSSISKASSSLIGYRFLIKNAAFPHIILPLSKLGVGLIDFIISLTCAVFFALFLGLSLHLVFLWGISIGILLVTTAAIGFFLAALFAKYTDLTELTAFFISLLFFLTPIVYPLKTVPSAWHPYIYLNPLTGAIETAKAVLFSPQTIPWHGLLLSSISSFVLLVGSIVIFHLIDNTLADIL